jgi:hypothetical protein
VRKRRGKVAIVVDLVMAVCLAVARGEHLTDLEGCNLVELVALIHPYPVKVEVEGASLLEVELIRWVTAGERHAYDSRCNNYAWWFSLCLKLIFCCCSSP